MVYVIGAVVVTVVVVVSGAGVSAFVVVVVTLVVVSALELSLFLEILSPLSILYRVAVIDLFDRLYVAAEVKSEPVPVAP